METLSIMIAFVCNFADAAQFGIARTKNLHNNDMCLI